MTTDTPESLLEAVGYDVSKLLDHRCRYTGPALGTPELDAVLLVESFKWCRDNWQLYQDVNDAIYKLNETEIDATDTFALEWLLFHCDQPGERLARAIWAAMKRGEK
jgi:hypothetical protein